MAAGNLKYSQIKGGTVTSMQPMKASEVFYPKSGRFVVVDDSDGYCRSAIAADAALLGWVEDCLTCSTTAGGTVLPVNVSTDAVYELPYYSAAAGSVSASVLTAALLQASIGFTCDLYVSTYQYCDLETGSTDVFICVGGSVERNTIYVKLNAAKQGQVS